jgi:hypothetical protein
LVNSMLVKDLEGDFPETLLKTFWGALNRLMGRTLSLNSVTESVKSRRVIICRDIMSMIPCPDYDLPYNLRFQLDKAPVSIERLQVMARWFSNLSRNVSRFAQIRVTKAHFRIQERDDRWITLASIACGLAVHDIERNVALGGDNMLLATLICISRQAIHSCEWYMLAFLDELAQIDIRRTLPGLQHDFCTLWNELVQEAKKTPELIPEIFVYSWGDQPLLLERYKTALGGLVGILRQIRHLYIALHQGTDAAPTAFSASTDDSDRIFHRPSSYPLCDIASHRRGRPGSTAHVPVPNSRTVPLLIQSIVSPDAAPLPSSDSTTPGEIGESSRVPEATSPALPVHTSPRPTDASPATAIAAALQDLPPAATLSHPQEGTTQQNIVAPCAESDISRILSTSSAPVPTPTLLPVPVPTPYVLNEPLASSEAGAASAFNPLLPASSVIGFSVPSSPPTSRVSSLPNAEFLSLLCTTPSCPTGNTALPHLRARGLVNTGNMCFANAVLQLLVHSPPLWNLFRQLGDLKGLRVEGGPATGGGATPLVDATVRFFEEFMNKEKAPTGQVTGGKPREGIGAKKEPDAVDPFEPTYIYDAMKEKRKFKRLLVRSRAM